MSFTKLTKDMAIIQKLDDEPNDTGGLTSAQLKAKFDEPGEAVKAWINNTFIPEAEQALSGALLGQVPENSITPEKLAWGVPNPNLLDNGYFGDPVNQKGEEEYPAGEATYTIDRWTRSNTNTYVAVIPTEQEHERALHVAASGMSATPYALQKLEFPKRLFGKTVTLSALSEGELYTKTAVMPLDYPATNKLYAHSDACEVLATKDYFAVRLIGRKGEYREFTAVKLELGSEQTLAHRGADGKWEINQVPDKTVETLKCQRYYQLFSGADKIPSHWADFRPAMRATPAIGTVTVGGETLYCADANL